MEDKIYSVFDENGGQLFEGTVDQFIDCFGGVEGVDDPDTIKAYCELDGWSYHEGSTVEGG